MLKEAKKAEGKEAMFDLLIVFIFGFTIGWYLRKAYGWWKGKKEPDEVEQKEGA